MLVPSFSALLRLYTVHDWPRVRNWSTIGISLSHTVDSWDLPYTILQYICTVLCTHAQGLGLTPCWGTKIPQVTRCSQKKKKKTSLLFLKLRYN